MSDRQIDPMSKEAVAARMKLLRRALADSQAQFCSRYEIDTNVWNNYERKTSTPNHEMADYLCKKIGVTMDWIYRGVEVALPGFLIDKMNEAKASPSVKKSA